MVTIRSTQPATFKELNGNVYQKVINAIRVQDVTLSCYVEDLGPDMLVRHKIVTVLNVVSNYRFTFCNNTKLLQSHRSECQFVTLNPEITLF